MRPKIGHGCKEEETAATPAPAATPEDEAMERRIVSRELGRAKRAIHALRNFYIANVILWAIPFLLLIFVVWAPIPIKMFFFAGQIAMIVGCFEVKKKPVPWGIAIASLWTLFSILRIYSGASIINVSGILTILWTIGCWVILPAAVRANQLIEQYPDLWISKQMRPGGRARRTKKRPTGGRGQRRR